MSFLRTEWLIIFYAAMSIKSEKLDWAWKEQNWTLQPSQHHGNSNHDVPSNCNQWTQQTAPSTSEWPCHFWEQWLISFYAAMSIKSKNQTEHDDIKIENYNHCNIIMTAMATCQAIMINEHNKNSTFCKPMTISFLRTKPQISFSLHDTPWSLIPMPTMSMMMPDGWFIAFYEAASIFGCYLCAAHHCDPLVKVVVCMLAVWYFGLTTNTPRSLWSKIYGRYWWMITIFAPCGCMFAHHYDLPHTS